MYTSIFHRTVQCFLDVHILVSKLLFSENSLKIISSFKNDNVL